MPDLAIETSLLTRYFGRHCAVDQVQLAVPQGSIFALLGRNGSGKTTILRILLGLLAPTRGSSRILNHDSQNLPPHIRQNIGYLAENHPLPPSMTVHSLANFQANFYPRWNPQLFAALTEHFRLPNNSKPRHLSRGQRAGLALALTLATQPELLVLDDPALGLDPVARRSLLESLVYATNEGGATKTILFSSHLLPDVERISDHLAILDHSILRAQCPLETFRNSIKRFVLRFSGTIPKVEPFPGLLETFHGNHMLRITTIDPGCHGSGTTSVPDPCPHEHGSANCADPWHPTSVSAHLATLNPDSLEEVPVSFEDALTTYLSDHQANRLFQQKVEGAA